jgi:signal transduction histidine kinase
MESSESEDAVSALANLLEAKYVAIAGYRQRDRVEGRLVLARNRKRFTDAEAVFLAQCAHALAAVVENITLTEELVARAAEFERLSISRDLHDTTVQPYIGLRMAIEGVAREFRDSPRVAERLAHLVEMTDLGIDELRDYTTRSRDRASGASPLALLRARRRRAIRCAAGSRTPDRGRHLSDGLRGTE